MEELTWVKVKEVSLAVRKSYQKEYNRQRRRYMISKFVDWLLNKFGL
jgi:hypothetical protein